MRRENNKIVEEEEGIKKFRSGRENIEIVEERIKKLRRSSCLNILLLLLLLLLLLHKPFLALLGDFSYFPCNRRSENRTQVT